MKLNKLSLLCAVACVGFAGHAAAQVSSNAAALAAVNSANANGRILYISGASAVQGGLAQIAATLFTGTNYAFIPSAASGRTNSDYRAFAGNLAQAAGGWAAGTPVIIVNRARGGSVQGVNPVARGESIESLQITAASCTAGAGTSAAPFLCNTLENRVPDAGVSDVAPRLFDVLFNTEGEPAEPELSPTELATLSAQPLYGLAFGVPMSNSLPLFNINKAAVSAIMTGNVGTWAEVDASLPGDDILLCRRVNGSGTQAVANLYYGNYPCGAANPPADRSSGSAWNGSNAFIVEGDTGFLDVVENSSSGNVRTCLSTASVAAAKPFVAGANPATGVGYTSYTTADRAGNPVTVHMRDGRPHKAIGVLSMDSLNRSSDAANNWSFRSLDGAGRITWGGDVAVPPVTTGTGRFPTLASYVDATWDQQGWISFNTPAATTGNKLALANQFAAAAKQPAILNGLASLRYVAAAIPGTPDPTSTGQVLRAAYLGGDQCAPLSRNF
jgi:ABC-type phosphate transport system substrate-binding protein